MRIISGKYGRRLFRVPHTFKARPTTDMAKENLFNILANQIDWEEIRALDLFAGTGSVGLEMLSRGARSVKAIEKDHAHAQFIKGVVAELRDPNYTLQRNDVLKYLKEMTDREIAEREQYDLVFADPPYQLRELPDLPQMIIQSGIIAPGGLLIVEHSKLNDFSHLPSFEEMRHYGSVHFSFFRPTIVVADDQIDDN
ncbi:MAG: RsmD family RNA methyltransferase [Porphyromonas sp.]|nr:RsmD family RNA methyltransferase [Porphyromonas sp.]